jgi:hypothetical protein
VVRVYVTGLATDTTTPDIVTRIFELTYLRPTTAGNTLDVSGTGEAGVDLSNIKQATGATTLTNITVPIVASVTALAAGAIDAAAIADDAFDAGSIKADAVTKIQSGLAIPGSLMGLADSAITAAKIADDAIDAGSLKVDAVTKIQAGLSTAADVVAAEADIRGAGGRDLDDLATPADVGGGVTVNCVLAVSAAEAAAVSSGKIAITLWHTFEQVIESDTTADLNAATKVWLGIKRDRRDIDDKALVLIELLAGLTVLAQEPYTGYAADGSLVLSGSSGAWEIRARLEESVTGDLVPWGNQEMWAEVKAMVGGDTVIVWTGRCAIGYETVRAIT